MKYKICVALALLMMVSATQAQRRRRAMKKVKVEVPVEDPRITQMLASVQEVVFIDSLVTDRDNFMSHIPLSPNSGKLTQNKGLGTFTNEMGDHRLTTLTLASDTATAIMSCDFIANRWTTPQPVKGLESAPTANPFLMPDGITLYFAQKGEKSIGGYDIFVTRYDRDKRGFLRPENIGMPFASEANDYFYAIDEFNQLGYFVTDRRQPRGKVCIYTFIPSETRRVYQSEAYGEEELRRLASINRIADTWKGKQQMRNEALARLESSRMKQVQAMRLGGNAQTPEIDTLRHQAEVMEKVLELTRKYYATATDSERLKLRDEILNSERQLEMLLTEIRNKEKQIPFKEQ